MDSRKTGFGIARGALAMPLFQHARASGIPLEPLLERTRLPRSFGEDSLQIIPTSSWHALAGDLAQQLGEPDIGYRLAIAKPLAAYSQDFTTGIATAPSLAEAFRFIDRHGRRHCTTHDVRIRVRGDYGYIYHTSTRDRTFGEEQRAAGRVASIIVAIREFLGDGWMPDLVAIDFDDACLPRDGSFDGVTITRRAHGGFVRVRREHLAAHCQKPIMTRVPHGVLVERELIDQLKQLLSTYVLDDCPKLSDVAAMLSISRRSLQRRLNEAGTSYSALVKETRYAVATQLLRDQDLRVIDIALSLGYDDASHFTRFFSRIAGITPRRYRRLAGEDVPFLAPSPISI